MSLTRRNIPRWNPAVLALVLALAATSVNAAPRIVLSPSSIRFDTTTVGDSAKVNFFVRNPGDQQLLVTGLEMRAGGSTRFQVAETAFPVVAGDSLAITVTFKPDRPGDLVDALVLNSNATSDPSFPPPAVSLWGVGRGSSLTLSPPSLAFGSTAVGVGVADSVRIRNHGIDTLRVTSVATTDSRFVPAVTSFNLAPGGSRHVRVTYTPTGSLPAADSLRFTSNAVGTSTTAIALNAFETPIGIGNARMGLSLETGTRFPVAGDTLTVLLTVNTNGDTLSGIEGFVAYDGTRLQPAKTDSPFVKGGLTAGKPFLLNRIVNPGTDAASVHFSVVLPPQTTGGTVGRIKLVALSTLQSTSLVRLLTEHPLYNSKTISPSGAYFTLPPLNRIRLGNSPPAVRPFPLLTAPEDGSVSIALDGLADDPDSALTASAWSFFDPTGHLQISVSPPTEFTGPVARFFPPANAFGVYPVTARVTDPTGASDSTVVVINIASVNDPPAPPSYSGPPDEATGIESPVTLGWSASDLDGDAITYELRFGTNELSLPAIATGLTATSYVVDSLALGTSYYWQVIANDGRGGLQAGPVSEFTTVPDQTAPTFTTAPALATVGNATAQVTWTTDEPTTGFVRVARQASFADSASIPPVQVNQVGTSHTASLTGLTPGSRYFYRVVSRDLAGNLTPSAILNFQTTGTAPLPSGAGDFTGDLLVNFEDFTIFARTLGTSSGDVQFVIAADLNSDGRIDFSDFVIFAILFGTDYN